MENEITVYEGSKALVKVKGMNYSVTAPMTGAVVTLNRDTDFGVIKGTKKPSLYKSGAEKIIAAYGMLQHYEVLTKIENYGEEPFFMYTIRCDLVRVSSDGKEYVFTSGIGSSNTKERRNGFNSAYDAAHTCIRMAMKRSMVAAAVNISGASDLFTSDIEDLDFVEGGYKSISNTQDPQSRISSAMVKRLFAIANSAGVNAAKAKDRLSILGYTKATELTQDKYDEVCEMMGLDDEEFKTKTSKENKG